MTTVVHCKRDKYDVYIGRPSKWGNPFKDGTREENIKQYALWIAQPQQDALRAQATIELRDKILGCWCKPKDCHGDILAAIAEGATFGA
jgi:hypothetical protein